MTKEQLGKEVEEYAEPKEAIKHFNPCSEWNDNVHDCEFRHYAIEYGNKLTKAKKIIKTLLRLWNDVMTECTVKSMIKEAEQFVKEIDK